MALDPRGATACVLEPAQHRLCVYRGTAAGIVPDACYAVVVPRRQHWPQWLVTAELTSRQMSLVDTTGRLRFQVVPAGEAAGSPSALQLRTADFAALAATVTRWRTGWVVRSASPTAASAPPAAAVRAAVEHWRQAWEHKQLADYVSSYAKSFRSPQDSDRAHWKARKRALFARSGSISIRLAGVSAFLLDEGRTVLTTFEQTYRSDIFASRAFKVLRWQHEDGRWTIAAETVLREQS
ncbi:MAG: hypothetical protein ACE5I7_17680 [Candidatus Binatia bacterium]